MTNAELISKIKAEIDKRYAEYREKMKTDDFTYYEGMADALDLFEQFIDTLESEKPVPNDLEEAADNHIREVVDAAGHPGWDWETQDIKEAFIAGAEWQKQDMLKEAVEGEITKDNRCNNVIRAGVLNNGFEIGDKVKLIVIKED